MLWVRCNGDERNQSAIEHYVEPASGECVLVSPRVKATVRVPSPVDGVRLRLRRGQRPFVPASEPSAAVALPDCPALQHQQAGCNGEDGVTTAMAVRTSSLCKGSLKQHLMPIGAVD